MHGPASALIAASLPSSAAATPALAPTTSSPTPSLTCLPLQVRKREKLKRRELQLYKEEWAARMQGERGLEAEAGGWYSQGAWVELCCGWVAHGAACAAL